MHIIISAVKEKNRINFKFLFNFGLVYLILLTTIFYSSNTNEGFLRLQTMLSLLIFPLYFSLIPVEKYKKIKINLFLWCYIISIVIFHLGVFIWFYFTEFNFQDTITHFQELITFRLGKLSVHPIYLSMNCCIAIFFCFYLLSKKPSSLKRKAIYFLQLLMFLFMILHAKKGPILAFIVTTIIYFLVFKKKVFIPLVVVLLLSIVFVSIPKVNKRFLEIFNIEKLTKDNANSTNIRVAIYKNSISLIKQSPFFGYGIGDYNQELKKKYKIEGQEVLLLKNYNSHNQYLSFLLIGGPLVLLTYMWFFYTNIKKALFNKNKIFVILLIFYSIVMLTENILERENGVIFYAFFLTLFGYKNYYKFDKE